MGYSFDQNSYEDICTPVITKSGCEMVQCEFKINSYPEKILVYIPKKLESINVHFHGYQLGIYSQYEASLPSMVSAFKLEENICKNNQAMVFPKSIGKCETYDSFFKDAGPFKKLIGAITSLIPQMNHLPISLSAHSGGGRTLARILDQDISSASLYDGIYSEKEVESISNWYRNTNGSLKLVAVKGETFSPFKFSKKILANLNLENQSSENVEIHGKKYTKIENSNLLFLHRELTSSDSHLLDHYRIVEETWGQ